MLYVDVKYANMLGPYLRNFKRKNEYLWNYSCPICGDSSKNKTKARGYIYKVKTGLFVKCHNCGYSTNLGNLVKYCDTTLYREYVLENYKEGGAPRSHHKSPEIAIPDIFKSSPVLIVEDDCLSSLRKISDLREDHPARQYCVKRKISEQHLSLLYFCPRFKEYCNSLLPDKFPNIQDDHPRLIIPYFTEHGKCFAFQGRAFGKETPKYYTIKLDDDEEKIFGLDRVDFSKRVYIVEGPIDSLFVPNCVAVSGSSFGSVAVERLKSNSTIIYDNEPRSKELTKLIQKTIDKGFFVCLWPETVTEKDINEMVINGKTEEDLLSLIDKHTYRGAQAKLEFSKWRKC